MAMTPEQMAAIDELERRRSALDENALTVLDELQRRRKLDPQNVRTSIAARKLAPPPTAKGDPNARVGPVDWMLGDRGGERVGFGEVASNTAAGFVHAINPMPILKRSVEIGPLSAAKELWDADAQQRVAAMERLRDDGSKLFVGGPNRGDGSEFRDMFEMSVPFLGPMLANAGRKMESPDPATAARGTGEAIGVTSGPKIVSKGLGAAKRLPAMTEGLRTSLGVRMPSKMMNRMLAEGDPAGVAEAIDRGMDRTNYDAIDPRQPGVTNPGLRALDEVGPVANDRMGARLTRQRLEDVHSDTQSILAEQFADRQIPAEDVVAALEEPIRRRLANAEYGVGPGSVDVLSGLLDRHLQRFRDVTGGATDVATINQYKSSLYDLLNDADFKSMHGILREQASGLMNLVNRYTATDTGISPVAELNRTYGDLRTGLDAYEGRIVRSETGRGQTGFITPSGITPGELASVPVRRGILGSLSNAWNSPLRVTTNARMLRALAPPAPTTPLRPIELPPPPAPRLTLPEGPPQLPAGTPPRLLLAAPEPPSGVLQSEAPMRRVGTRLGQFPEQDATVFSPQAPRPLIEEPRRLPPLDPNLPPSNFPIPAGTRPGEVYFDAQTGLVLDVGQSGGVTTSASPRLPQLKAPQLATPDEIRSRWIDEDIDARTPREGMSMADEIEAVGRQRAIRDRKSSPETPKFRMFNPGDDIVTDSSTGKLPEGMRAIMASETTGITLRDRGKYLVVDGIGVEPSLQRQGIGTRLYDEALALAAKDGKQLVSKPSGRTADSNAVWEKFKREGRAATTVIDGTTYDVLLPRRSPSPNTERQRRPGIHVEWPADPKAADENSAYFLKHPPSRELPERFKNARRITYGAPLSKQITFDGQPDPHTMGLFGRPFDPRPGPLPRNTALIAAQARDEAAAYTHETFHSMYAGDLKPEERAEFKKMMEPIFNAHAAEVGRLLYPSNGRSQYNLPQAALQAAINLKIPRVAIYGQLYGQGHDPDVKFDEAFSELGGQYMVNPTAFKKTYPQIYEWYKKLIGREFIGVEKAANAKPAPKLPASTKSKPGARGLVEGGNIDLGARPVVKSRDGKIMTVRSMSIGTERGEVLIPTISDDGRVLSKAEAIRQYEQTGKHLGIFDNPANATAYAKELSAQQDRMYSKTPKPAASSAPVKAVGGSKPKRISANRNGQRIEGLAVRSFATRNGLAHILRADDGSERMVFENELQA